MSGEKKPEVLHVKKFMGGREQPWETHRRLGLGGASCSTCGEKAALKAKLMAEETEVIRRDPKLFMSLIARCGGSDPAFQTKYGKMVVLNTVFACDRCKDGMRKFMAQQPDWVLVEFDEMGLESSHAAQVAVPK